MILGYGARNNIVKDFDAIWNAARYCNGETPSRGQRLLHSELFIVRLEHLTAHFNHKTSEFSYLSTLSQKHYFIECRCCMSLTGSLKHVKRLMKHEDEFDYSKHSV